MRARLPGLLPTLLPLLVVAAAVLVPLPGMLAMGATAMEEGNVLVVADLLFDGTFPHGDVEYLYAPGNVWAVGTAFWLFGPSVLLERLVGLAYRALLLWGLYRMARPWGRGTATVAALTAWVVLAPFGLLAYSWLCGLALLCAGTSLVLDGGARRSTAVGAGLLGLAVFHQVVLGPAVLLVLGTEAWRTTRARRRRLATGLVAGLSPFLLHLVLVGPVAAFEGMVVDPVFRLRAGRRLPLPPDPSESGDMFARVDDLLRGPDPWPGLSRPAQVTAVFWLLLATVALLLVLPRLWRLPHRRRFTTLALVGVAIVPMVLQRPSPNHLKFVGCYVFAVATIAVAVALGRRLPLARRHLAAPLALVAVVGLLFAVAPHHLGRFTVDAFGARAATWSTPSVTHAGRTLPVGDADFAADLEDVLAAVDEHTDPGDTVFVGPLDLTRTNYSETFLYFLLPDLVPASRHLEMNPGLANRDGGPLADELHDADLLVLTDRFDGWSEPNASVEPGSPEPARVVAERFCPAWAAERHQILVPCEPGEQG
ncbi:MAG: hypothetical protein CL441_08305 [Acidimicrobiaceae bacterium]|nr:hypothetical protein [Acidimicrobiaceae bacterium]